MATQRTSIILAIALTAAAPAAAYDIQNARPLALAGASRANCPSNAALFLNPAGLALGRMYHVETLYGYVPTINGHLAGGSVVDSITAPVAMGLSFNYLTLDPEGRDQNEYDVRLSAAYYAARIIAFGLTLKYLYADRNGQGELTESIFRPNGDPLLNTVTLDVGATITLGRFLSLAVVGHNLTHTESSAAPLALGMAAGLNISQLVVVADVLLDFTTLGHLTVRYMGGMEYFLLNRIPLRVGYRYDEVLDTHSVSTGLGYLSQRFGVELSLRQDVAGEKLHSHLGLSLRYFAN
jgi:hypothetical protein